MKLLKFVATGLHGFLNFEVKLHDRLTFLTGINGSGKTTVLNAIVALISPDLASLQALSFSSMQIDFIGDDNSKAFIRAEQIREEVKLTVGTSKVAFTYLKFIPEPSIPTYRQAEAEAEHFRELLVAASAHPVMKFIASLPTPMFLGLDRRARLGGDERRPVPGSRYRPTPSRNVFGGSLAMSLYEAEELAQSAYRDARFQANSIGEELQRQMLLNLLTFTREDYSGISIPTDQEIRDLKKVRDALETFPSIFHLPKAEVEKRVRPFLEQLQKTVNSIPSQADIEADFEKRGSAPHYMQDLIIWSANRSQLKKIKVISHTVADYNERRAVAMRPFDDYKSLINGFLKDSGKTIIVTERGGLSVKIDGVDWPKPLSSLSSGEAQIFVILTNLTFNPAAQKANVFIIDEPELSLHVRWQEMFVDSALSANKKIQFVMATHSPSIILERLDNCVEVAAKTGRQKRA